MTDVVERYQWRRNKEAAQEFGSRMVIAALNEGTFRLHLRPLLVDGVGETLAQYQRRFPGVTHYRMVFHDGQLAWKVTGFGSLEELRPGPEEAQWALLVEVFGSPEAIAWGSVADSEIEGERQHAKGLTVEE